MANPVTTKQDFYRRFMRGEFGNHGPMWSTYDEYQQSHYPGLIAIRTKTPGGKCIYNIPAVDAECVYHSMLSKGSRSELLNFSAMCPDDAILMQGEVKQTQFGLSLLASRAKVPMRPALSDHGFRLNGLAAHYTLKTILCPNSWDWLNHMLDAYQDHAIEFSSFNRPWGVLPHFNTVFWEVRSY